jgi:predicted SAM-dependent methyltransferase
MENQYEVKHYAIQVGEKEFVNNYDLSFPPEKRIIATTKKIKEAFQLINHKVGLYVAEELNGKLIEIDRCDIN